MVAPSHKGFTGAQKATIGLTGTSVLLVFISAVLVLQQLTAVDAGPGFAESVILVDLPHPGCRDRRLKRGQHGAGTGGDARI